MKGFLAERLVALRKANGMTATQCAAELEISIAAWSQWEKAKRDPPIESLPKICWMFGVTMSELFNTDKLCNGRKVSVTATHGGIAIGGNVSGTIVTPGESSSCAKCPFKKKLQALEKVLGKS